MSKGNTEKDKDEFYKKIFGEEEIFWSQIIIYIMNNDVEAIKPLVNETNVNTLFSLVGPFNSNGQKECVLNVASSLGRYNIVKYLLEIKADVNQQNTTGWSPIM